MYMFSGMAEMGGPFDPNADPRTWIKGLKDMKGVIPVHWIVAKDVEFSVFDHLKHNSQRVTETRNANVSVNLSASDVTY